MATSPPLVKAKPKKKEIEYTFGSDPEFCLYDLKQRKMVSAIPVLKNDKYTPVELGNGALMYADNVMVEFAFPPVKTTPSFQDMIRQCLQQGQKHLGPRYRLVAQAAHEYDESELQDPAAREAGCSPNLDVYAQKPNPPPKFTGGMRTGSFHLHIGSEVLQTKEEKDRMIMALDAILGCSSILFDKDPTCAKRRSLYGRAGEFRPTAYGIEYRVLGPYALRSPDTVKLVMDLVEFTLYLIRNRMSFQTGLMIPAIINEHDGGSARAQLEGVLTGDLYDRVIANGQPPDLYRDFAIAV